MRKDSGTTKTFYKHEKIRFLRNWLETSLICLTRDRYLGSKHWLAYFTDLAFRLCFHSFPWDGEQGMAKTIWLCGLTHLSVQTIETPPPSFHNFCSDQSNPRGNWEQFNFVPNVPPFSVVTLTKLP
jgi:hypothetical protein